MDAFFDEQEDIIMSHLPAKIQYPVSHSSMPDLNAGGAVLRRAARPKVRLKTVGSVARAANGDFDDEEAGFLMPMEVDEDMT